MNCIRWLYIREISRCISNAAIIETMMPGNMSARIACIPKETNASIRAFTFVGI